MDAIERIKAYMDENLFEPSRNWPLYETERRIYSRWAVTEIIEALSSRPMDFPEIVVEEFLIKMIIFSRDEDGLSNQMFVVAKEVAEDILHLIKT